MSDQKAAPPPDFLQHCSRTARVVLRAIPIWLPVLLFGLLLALTDQGRAFLTIGENDKLLLPISALGFVAFVFSRNHSLIYAGTPDHGTEKVVADGQMSGVLIVTIFCAMFVPCVSELYLASPLSHDMPPALREGIAAGTHVVDAALILIIVTGLLFAFILAGRTQGDLMLLAVIAGAAIAGGLIVARQFTWPYPTCTLTAAALLASVYAPPKYYRPIMPTVGRPTPLGHFSVSLTLAVCMLAPFPTNAMALGSMFAGVVGVAFCIAVLMFLFWLLFQSIRLQLWSSALWGVVGFAFVVASIVSVFNARPVRELPLDGSVASPAAVIASEMSASDVEAFAKRWLAARRDEMASAGAENPYSIFVVAAPGGGIRAGYWSAGILAALQDRDPVFARHVLGISGVSGGSVGAGVFAALLKDGCSAEQKRSCRTAASSILKADYLAPTLFSMLTIDGPSALLGRTYDRGTALEIAFESEWAGTIGTETLSHAYRDLWSRDPSVSIPGLFINVTNAATGEQLVLSPIATSASVAAPTPQQILQDSRLRLSTAMVLGARYPFISPEGLLSRSAKDNGGEVSVRLTDGGLSDNSGLRTTLPILQAIRAATAPGTVEVYLLDLDNRAATPSHLSTAGPFHAPLQLWDRQLALMSESLTDIFLDKIRVTTGANVLKPVRPVNTYLLGWTLPESARKEMDVQIKAALDGPLKCIDDALAGVRNACSQPNDLAGAR